MRDSQVTEQDLRRAFHEHHARRLTRVFGPPGVLGHARGETVITLHDDLAQSVDRVDGQSYEVVSRALGRAVGAAVSKSQLYHRFRGLLDKLLRDARPASRDRFNASDVLRD